MHFTLLAPPAFALSLAARRAAVCIAILSLGIGTARAQVISTPPQSQTVAAGTTATFTVTASGPAPLSYQWQKNGTALAGATSSALTINNPQSDSIGIYTVVVTSGTTSASASAALGLTTTSKVIGSASEIGPDIRHANGNTYDQLLLEGTAATITADANQVTRISYVDLNDDIVQVELSGAGSLSLLLESASGPAAPANYNQPGIAYMKGHAGIVITGANETTHVAVVSVGSLTAVNQALFKAETTYDGVADIAYIAILSANGRFGAIRTANTSFFATKGLTGIYAPGVQFTGPVYVGDINAFGAATPVLLLGSATDTRITGGDLLQSNAQPVTLSGIAQLSYVAGTTSHSVSLAPQVNQGVLKQDGVDVTARIVAFNPNIITLTASMAAADETGGSPGEFTVTRTGVTLSPLSISYGVSGDAINGIDYPALLGTVTIPAGASSVKIALQPYPDTSVENTESVTLALAPGSGYTIGYAATATVSIRDNPGTLYVATLRPASTATASASSGLATIVLSASGTLATVNVSFSNLSAGQVGAHLFLGNSTSAGDYVLNLPLGQVTGAQWIIQPTATYTSTQILDALRNGLIYVGLDSAQYPAGEVRGSFLSALGSQTFTAPAAPPPVALTNVTATDAARLLTQATFGPRQSEIDALTGSSIDTWITAQMALPASSHRTATVAERTTALSAGEFDPTNNPYLLRFRQRAWFQHALTAPDQLRQRVAFALSQILVVSDVPMGNNMTEPLAHYYDLLVNQAFGSFRTLLESVTLSPVMGLYLSHLRNAKADPVTGTNPDENYAREVMQLFTIGLVQLQPDGTLKLDAQGLPIPTYTQTTITEMAKVFTGWGFYSTMANPSFRGARADYLTPMMLYPASHESAPKFIVNNLVIPANLGGTEDLKRALDALVGHPNTAPFIARQLIQRLVTANPSPAYVYRVAQKFGTTGDLGAMVRAVLTDYEARSPVVLDDPGYGKLKEPLLRFAGFLRSFNAASSSGRNLQDNVEVSLAQAALRAQSVFNFFEPGYVFPGPLAAAGLVAPELQITDDTTAISVPNFLRNAVFAAATGTNAAKILVPSFSAELGLVTNVSALLDRLNLLMAGGQMSAATRARITTALNVLPVTTAAQQLERVQTAVLLVATSPDGASQR
jgi:uncharacterized protein (DUF1800 family)